MMSLRASFIGISLALYPCAVFAFGPCSAKMPAEVSYIPDLPQCSRKAAVIVTGKLRESFSIVVRGCDNGDRDPCHRKANECASNASSPFKVQKILNAVVLKGGKQVDAKIHCLKEKGSHAVYKMVRRITIKRVNPVVNVSTDVLKICLSSRTRTKNEVKVISSRSYRYTGNVGGSAVCSKQEYLSCDFAGVTKRLCAGR